MNNKPKNIALLSIYIAIAFIFGYIESLFPLPIPFPGIKLGLANLVIVLALYQLGFSYAITISFLRNLLNAFTFGSLFSFFYSLTGSFASLLAMQLIKQSKKTQLSLISISCVGGIIHNMGQFAVAACLVGISAIRPYLPFLYFAGLVAGVLIGIFAKLCLKRLNRQFFASFNNKN